MTDAMKKRLAGLAAILVAGAALGYLSMGDLGDNLVYYWTPTELLAQPNAKDATVRLGGMVEAGTYQWDKQSHRVEFDISDKNKTIHVVSTGNPPQMFREGIGVVVEGQLGDDGVFYTEKIMVKHDNQYEAPEGGEKPSMASMAGE